MELEIIPVTGQIKLGQFLKLANLVEDGANPTIDIQRGYLKLNGEVETRRGHRLNTGDKVIVDLPTGVVGAQVG